MTCPPIQMTYSDEGVFLSDRRQRAVCDEHFGQGEVVTMARVEERSRKSHDHYFVTLGELFDTLPEHLNARWPTFDSFRKSGLIETGHCDTDTTVCATKAEAERLTVALKRHLPPECLTVLRGVVVTVYTPLSQSLKAMGKDRFQASKDDVLGWANEQVQQGAAKAGGESLPRRAA